MSSYYKLNRRFVHRPKYDPAELFASEVSGKRLDWAKVLENRFSVVVAPANFGKTTEMRHRAVEMRSGSEAAVFVALRKLADRGSFEKALEPDDRSAYQAWKMAPTSPLTILVDSLDEAAASGRESIAYLVGDVAEALAWPNRFVRWVISTRPAVLTAEVIDKLTSTLITPMSAAAAAAAATSTLGPSTALADSASTSGPVTVRPESERLQFFSMAPLDVKQAECYLAAKHPSLATRGLLQVARERGLAGFTTSPGGLDVVAHIDLLTNAPRSLTDVFHRVADAVQELQRQDHRTADAGNPAPLELTQAAQRIASASQVCQLPNVEMPEENLGVTEGVLSARLIASPILTEKALTQMLNSQLFIDVGYHQVKLYPDELSPFLAAQRIAALVQSPEQAHQLVQLFTWKAPTGEQGVYRQFLPLIGWLGTLNPHCREEILDCDPQAIAFFGDLRNPLMPPSAARAALRESVRRLACSGDRLGRGAFSLTSENYWQAGPDQLMPLLRQLFDEYGDYSRARNALLDIATSARSNALRKAVLRDHSNDYARLLSSSSDARYILELGLAEDLAGIAAALKIQNSAGESLVASTVEILGWSQLTPTDLANLVHKQFTLLGGGFHISYAFGSKLFDSASDWQLYLFCRSIVIRVSRLPDEERRLGRGRARTNDRYVELAIEAVTALIDRATFTEHGRAALLCLLIQRIVGRAHAGAAELAELRRSLMRNVAVRRRLLAFIVKQAKHDSQKLWTAIYGYESICDFTDKDVETLQSAELTALVAEQRATQALRRVAPQQKQPDAKEQQPLVGAKAKKQLLEMLEQLRDGSAGNGLAWVANWLLQTNPNSRYGEVTFDAFEREVGSEIAKAVREGFAKIWRDRAPMHKEDEPQTTYHITVAGLQGLHLEFGEGIPGNLTEEEVRSALRYAFFEINGYPKWFWPLVNRYQTIAGRELLQIVNATAAGPVSLAHAEAILTSLVDAPPLIQHKLAPLAWQYLQKHPKLQDYVVEKLLAVVTRVAGVVTQNEFENTTWDKMQSAFSRSAPDDTEAENLRAERHHSVMLAAAWLTGFPTAFRKAIARWLRTAPDSARALIFELAAYLGIDRGAKLVGVARLGDEGVAALEALYRWTLEAVRPEEDNTHVDGEVYTPNQRDQAEDFRDALIPAIAAARSQLAYDVLERLRLAASGQRAAYLHSVQFEMREAQYARPALAQKSYNDFERNFTVDVTDTTSFAMTIHSDLLAVKYDIERGDYSLRRFFTEVVLNHSKVKEEDDKRGLALEADFQRLLASELHHHAKGRYSVTVEPHTAEAKRRDVLCSKGDLFASIELKMSMRWTVEQYVEALEKQLVGQYMRHRKATTGFLVIVLQKKTRTWVNPTTGKKIDFEGLLELLSKRASALEAKDRRRFLRVIGIDATSPESFRNTAKAKRKSSAAMKNVQAHARHGSGTAPKKVIAASPGTKSGRNQSPSGRGSTQKIVTPRKKGKVTSGRARRPIADGGKKVVSVDMRVSKATLRARRGK